MLNLSKNSLALWQMPLSRLFLFLTNYCSFQDVNISLERINEIHNSRNEESDTGGLIDFPINAYCDINLRGVSFKYSVHSPTSIIEDVTFSIPAGKVTAIVGESGCGKTTLIKLILGYYNVSQGEINIAGIPLKSYSIKWWRRQCGVVMQNGAIFSESIARNIAVDDGPINYEKLVVAAKIANIHDYIVSQPLKYDTIIGRDGMNLSQGQKQRILIARAVYKNPKYIFFDEATNSLDTENERLIVQRLSKFYQGRTVVIVAHRLSTVKKADQIIVLKQGRIIEVGSHVQLVAQNGYYFNLVKSQLELDN